MTVSKIKPFWSIHTALYGKFIIPMVSFCYHTKDLHERALPASDHAQLWINVLAAERLILQRKI